MFREIASIAVGLSLSASGAFAGDKGPIVLKREGVWVVDYDRDSCNLFAQFGSGEDTTIVKFTRYDIDDGFHLSIYSKLLKMPRATSDAKLDFGLGGQPIERTSINGESNKLKASLLGHMRLDGWERKSGEDERPAVAPEVEAKVTGLTFALKGNQSYRFEFGSLGKPFATMRHCIANLVKSWGYDPDEQAALLQPVKPKSSPGTWLSSDDYPKTALVQNLNGIVQFRLDVDAAGKVVDCYVLARTNPDEFADATCKAIKRRAKFNPALDAGAKPVRSFFVSRVLFKIG